MSAVDVALRLVDRINAHDIDGLDALLTPNHRINDSMGVQSRGRATLRAGWGQYFQVVPDYRVEVERAFGEGRDAVLVGVAGGTYTADGELRAENRWTTHAAWRARVQDDLVAEWQVYADNEPMRRCIARASA